MLNGWFQKKPISKIGFQDMQHAIQNDNYIIINTLPAENQDCLIKNTLTIDKEEQVINQLIDKYTQKPFIIYGKNAADSTVDIKYNQLVQLGFRDVYIYSGGMFEWMLLQDIYNKEEFPTTRQVLDILKYKPPSIFQK
jgi:hypothetical protein